MGQWVAVTLSISSRFACLFCCCKAWPGMEAGLGRAWSGGEFSAGGSHMALDPTWTLETIRHQPFVSVPPTPALSYLIHLHAICCFSLSQNKHFLHLIPRDNPWRIPFEPKAQQEIKIMSQYPDWRQSHSILWALWWVFVEFQPTAIIIISLLQPS